MSDNMSMKEERLHQYDDCTAILRGFIEKGEGRGNDIRYASFLLGKIAWLMRNLYEPGTLGRSSCYRMAERIGREFNGRCFLYLEGSGILSKKVDVKVAAGLIAGILEGFCSVEREEILENVKYIEENIDYEDYLDSLMEEE